MPIGGAEKVLLDIFNNIDYAKYNVELLLYTNSGENLKNVPSQVKILSAFQPKPRTLFQRIFNKLINVTGLISLIEKYKTRLAVGNSTYDVIISFCQGPGHKMHTFLLDKAKHHISWIHNDLSKENWGKLFFSNSIKKQEKAYHLMDEIVHVSYGVKEAFNSVFSIPSSIRQSVIYNIVDTANILKFAIHPMEIKLESEKFVFINSGRIVSQKKQIRLVEAAKILVNKGFDFEIWILGDGPLRPMLESRINELGLNKVVKLIGFVSNPYPYIRRADSFVLSSSQEGFSIVVCEALALGKPIISTKVVGPTELLGDSEYGLMVSEEVDDIANAMETFLTDENVRHKYIEAAKKRALMFNVENTMKEIYKLLEY